MSDTVKVRLTGPAWSEENTPWNTGDIVDASPSGHGWNLEGGWHVWDDTDCNTSAEVADWSGDEVEEVVDLDARTISFHPVKAPSHYHRGGYELLDVIEAWDLDKDAYKKEAVCYIMRSGFKGSEREDIEKAVRYLNRWLIRNREDT